MKEEFNLALVLVLIVLVFFVCNSPKAVVNAYEFYCDAFMESDLETSLDHDWYLILCVVSNFLIMANSAINFMIYMVAVTSFRQAFGKPCNSFRSSTGAHPRTVVESTDESKQILTTRDTILTTDPPVLIPRQPTV